MMIGEKGAKRQMGLIVDRISDLPEFILHIILSSLDPKDACRASILSKRWYEALSSIPVLEFRPDYFKNESSEYSKYEKEYYDVETVESFVGFIDKTMQRYSNQKHRIRRLYCEFPEIDEKVGPLIDKWIEIAVENQIQELDIKILVEISPDYVLPEVLFRANSLKVLKCEKVELPYYEIMKLTSLESLNLKPGSVNEDMLQRIISFCPLIELDITQGDRLKKIALPWRRERKRHEVSSLRKFAYHGMCESLWPWTMNLDALRNLRKLKITCADITDDIVSKLVSGLVALEKIVLYACISLENIKISSISLKKCCIVECERLEEATIYAPNLRKFWYNGQVETSLSMINVQDHCNTHLFIPITSISTEWFIKLKEFLEETNIFKFVVMDLSNCNSDQVEVDEDQLRNTATGSPYKLQELSFYETFEWDHTESSLSAFLDGLFWCCHPDLLLITTGLQNKTAELIVNILKDNVQCWKHPLKRIEVEGADCSRLLSRPSEIEMKFRLSW